MPETKIKILQFCFMKLLSSPYTRFVEGISTINLAEAKTLRTELKEFNKCNTRLIIAFRHPAKHDPALLMFVLNNRYLGKTHCHFLYGNWVLMWANSLARWLFPGIGAIPISNRGNNLAGIKTVRKVLIEGKHPLALAPEAQVTYHNGKCGELEPGVITMASWCKDDLEKLGIDKKVHILPITQYYDYTKKFDKSVKLLKNKINNSINSDNINLYTDYVLDEVEGYYIKNCNFERCNASSVEKRLHNLTINILKVAEDFLNTIGTGSYLNRILTIRESFSVYISQNGITEDCKNNLKHMEVVDILEYIDPGYIENLTDKNRIIEYLLNLLDLLNRLNGGTIATRFSGIHKDVKIISGEPIEYKKTISRAQKKSQIKELNTHLYKVLGELSR